MNEDFKFTIEQREQIYDIIDNAWAENISFDTAIKRIERVIQGLAIDENDIEDDEDDDVDD